MSTKSTITGKLKRNLTLFLAKKDQAAKLDSELKELKADIDQELDQIVAKNGFVNGKLGLPGLAMISVAMNPPKLVWSNDGQSLTPADREGLALVLPEQYVIQGVKLADVFKAVDRGNTEIKTLLASKGIDAVQDSRYDIKRA